MAAYGVLMWSSRVGTNIDVAAWPMPSVSRSHDAQEATAISGCDVNDRRLHGAGRFVSDFGQLAA